MGSADFRQSDSRWGSKNYNGTSTMSQAGCGPTSVADIVYNIDTAITPWKVAKWMKEHGYAIPNQGTSWAGIPAALKHYGLEDVREIGTVATAFDLIGKGYKAVFLMHEGKRNGVVWTTGGHFIAVTAAKKKDGDMLFWTRDPGPRKHDGWHGYHASMEGLIRRIWVGRIPEEKMAEKTKAQKLVEMAKKCAWKYGTSRSKCRYPDGKRKKAYTEALKKAYGERKGWGKQTKAGASCDVFVGTVVRASGVDKSFPRGLSEQYTYLEKSKKWKKVKKKKAGDIVIQKYNSGGGHIMIYLGSDRLANAHYNGKTYGLIEKASKIIKSAGKCKFSRIYRAK